MDFWVAFWTAVFTGLAIWILKKIGKRRLSKRLGQTAAVLGFVPIVVIFSIGIFRMVNAGDPSAADAIGAQTAIGLKDWFSTNFISIIAGDIGGFMLAKVLP